MPYKITITEVAESQLEALSVREQRILQSAILTRLIDAPTTATRAIKVLRPNPFAQFELRVRDLRVLYNVEEAASQVVLLIVGRKDGNKLIVEGEDFHGHQSDSPQPPGSGPAGNPE